MAPGDHGIHVLVRNEASSAEDLSKAKRDVKDLNTTSVKDQE
jgi:hypothetical protein